MEFYILSHFWSHSIPKQLKSESEQLRNSSRNLNRILDQIYLCNTSAQRRVAIAVLYQGRIVVIVALFRLTDLKPLVCV